MKNNTSDDLTDKTEAVSWLYDQAEDTSSGAKGEVIAVVVYTDRATEILIQPKLDKDGRHQSSVWTPLSRAKKIVRLGAKTRK